MIFMKFFVFFHQVFMRLEQRHTLKIATYLQIFNALQNDGSENVLTLQ